MAITAGVEATLVLPVPGGGLEVAVGADGVVRLAPASYTGPGVAECLVPLLEVGATGYGREWSGERFIDTVLGTRLAYRSHTVDRQDGWERLRVELHAPVPGLVAEVELSAREGLPVLRARTTLRNEGSAPVALESVSLLTLGGLTDGAGGLGRLDLHWADNDWLAECRWQRAPLRERVVDLDRGAHGHEGRHCFSLSSQGTWSTGRHLPMGAVTDRHTGRAWAWQIESSSGWRFEVGEREHAAYLALFGPDDAHHQWRRTLAPGEEFSTVPAALAYAADGGIDEAFGLLTRYRREIRRPHPDNRALPVVYNDYMNTLMGDPTTERLLPLIEAAAAAGSEYFVIDAGWYDDDMGWWDSVGLWEPSTSRFPGGLQKVLDAIRDAGMTPGLWLEPEVVGVRSPIATTLPDDAFFQRGGARVTEHGRHLLDLRHPEARGHLDAVVDRIVGDWGVGYLKLDYNVNPGPGTDLGGLSAGAGLVGHAQAHLAWLDSVLDRHPGLVLENCGSGGLRMDYAILARTQLQSTSDQQNHLYYPPIAAAAPTAVTPEQGAVWAYPQPGFSDEEIVFTLASAMLGRIHLSGFLDRMAPDQHALVAEAVSAYKGIRGDLARAVPFWPLGLPQWDAPWLALGLRSERASYLTVWHREPAAGAEAGGASCTLPVPRLRGRGARLQVVFPSTTDATASWDDERGELTVGFSRTPCALVVRLIES